MMQGNVGSIKNVGIDGSEVDIMEAFGWTDKINQAIHWDGYGTEHKSIGNKETPSGIRNGFHTYAMEWYPEMYIFYIDGKETRRKTGGGVCNQKGYLKVTGEISTEDWAINQYWSNNPENAEYQINYDCANIRNNIVHNSGILLCENKISRFISIANYSFIKLIVEPQVFYPSIQDYQYFGENGSF